MSFPFEAVAIVGIVNLVFPPGGGMAKEGDLILWYTGIRQMISCFVGRGQHGGPRSSEMPTSEVGVSPPHELAPSVDGLALLGIILPESGDGVPMGSSFVLCSVLPPPS